MIFAILLFPLMLIIAASIDTSRHAAAQRQIQAAADAATLSGALILQDEQATNEDVLVAMHASFEFNRRSGQKGLSCALPEINVKREDDAVELSVDCQIPKIFGGVFASSSYLSISRTAHATHGTPTLDVALMLDVSGSMEANDSLDPLKDAANTFVSTLVTEEIDGRIRVALVPYGDAVNAGIYGNRAQGKADDNDDDGDGVKVCVSHRENEESQYTDVPPSTSHYVGDAAWGVCEVPLIVPLTSDTSILTDAIGELVAESRGTAGHLGLAWSWYAISSNWNTIWPEASKPKDNSDRLAFKAIVMMTDGVFNRHHGAGGRRQYTHSAVDAMALCESIQARGIAIYVIALNVSDPTFSWANDAWLESYGPNVVLSKCAGDESRLFRPTESSELEPLYEAIAKKLETEPLRLQQ